MLSNSKPTAEDLARLPKWVQNHIRDLEREVESQAAAIRELTSEFPFSNVMVDGGSRYGDRTLPPNSKVEFYLTTPRVKYSNVLSVHHAGQYRPGEIEVSCATGQIAVLPQVSNLVRLKIIGH